MSYKSQEEALSASEGRITFTDLTLMLHYKCNFRCRDCLIGDKLDSGLALDFDQAKHIIDQAAELRTIRAVALAGGEPFLNYKLMLQIAEYTWANYRCGISVSTNCSWAKSPEFAYARLKPLRDCGMRWMLASWDSFHAEFGNLDSVVNAIGAAQRLEILVSLQNITTNDSFRNQEIRKLIESRVDADKIDWVENSVVPVGLGETGILDEEQTFLPELPIGDCNAGTVMNIETNGEVKPCCGAAFMNPYLSLGNVFKEPLKEIVERASADPRINAVIAHQGPGLYFKVLEEAGRKDLIPRQFSSSCDACNRVLNNFEARSVIDSKLKEMKSELIIARMFSQYQELA
jgi:MoaA/NifB/PqqE/SkfB family radical SAM enzyme